MMLRVRTNVHLERKLRFDLKETSNMVQANKKEEFAELVYVFISYPLQVIQLCIIEDTYYCTFDRVRANIIYGRQRQCVVVVDDGRGKN